MIVDRDELKRAAALRAIDEVEDGMVLGLGTGSTAAFVVEGLAARVAAGLRVVGIPSSERTAVQARGLGITIDGADEVELGSLNLIKGLGGALLREKIVAAASGRLVIVVDQEKLVERLGEHTPVPVEVTQFGWQRTAVSLTELGCTPERRYMPSEQPYVTDGGNFILDCRFGPIRDPAALEARIAMTVGVVESGLFVGRSSVVVVASETGVEVLTPPTGDQV